MKRVALGARWGICLGTLLPFLPGCNGKTAVERDETLPKIGQLHSRLTKREDPFPDPARPVPTARVHRVLLPAEAPLDVAWAIVHTQGLPAETIARWRANGMRLGLLDQNHTSAFVAALQSVNAIQTKAVFGSRRFAAQTLTPRLSGSTSMQLWDPRGVRSVLTLRGGRMQFLLRLARGDGPQVQFELVPHHHRIKHTFEVRSPFETMLDGRIFNELQLKMQWPFGQLLVVSLEDDTAPSTAEFARMGDLLLRTGGDQIPLQTLLIVAVDD